MSQQYPPMPAGYGYAPQQPLGASDPNDLRLPLYGATFGQAVNRFFKQYFSFTGRASRSEYWWTQLFIFLVGFIPTVLVMIGLGPMMAAELNNPDSIGQPTPIFWVGLGLALVISVAFIIPELSLTWRRLHDANFSGLFWLLTLIPGGSFAVFIMTLLPSNALGMRFDR